MDSSRLLPSGVVTFLLTDIEGSTRLWEREPDQMRTALERHDAVVNACVRRQHGHVVKSKGEGDSVFAVFEHVRDAVTAALVLQCALAVEDWPTTTPIRVRMAVHTGQVEMLNGDYNGVSVNRCARLRALASGGQVLLSGVTAQLAATHLPTGAGLTDLGSHQLKDLSAPERVWQLTHPRMPSKLTRAGEPGEPNERTSSTSNPPNVAEPGAATSLVTSRSAYVLTDELNRSADGREWGRRVKQIATGLNEDDEDGHIDCYTSPNVAALLNSQNERFRLPRLWEASVEPDFSTSDAVVACRTVTTSQQVTMPSLTGMHHARFAVLCARAAYTGGSDEATEFGLWAEGWLNGQDRSGINARAVASMLEAAADRGTVVGHPEGMMAANAARSAMHAAGLSLRGGREHAEETTRTVHFATEAVRTALRMTRMDLPALADQVINSGGGLSRR